jgi:tRNA_anti-like
MKFAKYILVLVSAMIVAVAAMAVLFKEPTSVLINNNTEKKLSVDDLFNYFIENEGLATHQFLKKEIFVHGRLSSISPLWNNQTILKLEGYENGSIHCMFATAELYGKINDLKLNSEITLKGECIGFLDEVYLSNCTLLSVKNLN